MKARFIEAYIHNDRKEKTEEGRGGQDQGQSRDKPDNPKILSEFLFSRYPPFLTSAMASLRDHMLSCDPVPRMC